MTLSSFLKQLSGSRRIVTPKGFASPELMGYIKQLELSLNSNVTEANTDITKATQSTISFRGDPGASLINSDTAGAFPAGNPTYDLVGVFEGPDGTTVATRTLRGTLTSSNGNLAVTAVSNTQSTGYSTAYTLSGDGTPSVRADITLTTPLSKVVKGSLTWTAIDESTAGETPVSGGSK